MSDEYIYDLTTSIGLKYQRVKKRLELTPEVVATRLLYCRYRAHQKTRKQREYIQSDEYSIERSKEGEIVQVQGHSSDKQKLIHVETYKKGKGIRVIVLVAFQGNRERLDLLILERNFKSKKYRYSTNSYLALLENLVLLNYTNDLIFIQDNTLIYIVRKVIAQFTEYSIRVIDQPPYSLDLNLIEYTWKRLKDIVLYIFPKLQKLNRKSKEN